MGEFGERAPKISEVSADFDAYACEQVARFNGLSDFLTDSLPIVEDLDTCNAALTEAGRPDLAIVERAEMMPVSTPEEVTEKCNNFLPKFHFHTGSIEPKEGDFGRPTPIPATKEEILALKDVPKIESHDEIKDLEQSAAFPAFSLFNHAPKPAFTRMLVLFPAFTVDLASRMSQPEAQNRMIRFEPELFVAYQLMARLVDISDRDVIRKRQAEPDDWYLYR